MIKITGKPVITITDKTYSAGVPVASYDNGGWVTGQVELIVSGDTDTVDLAADILVKLKPAVDKWEETLKATEVLDTKVSTLVGKEIK